MGTRIHTLASIMTTDFQYGSASVKDTGDSPAKFPGESYTIVQYKDWYRSFQGKMAKKGLLKVLMSGVADHKVDATDEEKQRSNRPANSSLYGHLIDFDDWCGR